MRCSHVKDDSRSQSFTFNTVQNHERWEETPSLQCPEHLAGSIGALGQSRWLNCSRNANRRRNSGHNHQGVNSLAHSKSLQSQTGELGCQSSSEDFGFEPRTKSPRLSGQFEGSTPKSGLTLTRLDWKFGSSTLRGQSNTHSSIYPSTHLLSRPRSHPSALRPYRSSP